MGSASFDGPTSWTLEFAEGRERRREREGMDIDDRLLENQRTGEFSLNLVQLINDLFSPSVLQVWKSIFFQQLILPLVDNDIFLESFSDS